jgi:hypothetical protein
MPSQINETESAGQDARCHPAIICKSRRLPLHRSSAKLIRFQPRSLAISRADHSWRVFALLRPNDFIAGLSFAIKRFRRRNALDGRSPHEKGRQPLSRRRPVPIGVKWQAQRAAR